MLRWVSGPFGYGAIARNGIKLGGFCDCVFKLWQFSHLLLLFGYHVLHVVALVRRWQSQHVIFKFEFPIFFELCVPLFSPF